MWGLAYDAPAPPELGGIQEVQMAFVMRRIFYGKTGSGDELIKICNDGNFLVRALGIAIKPRVLSDFNSGRTDRITVEWEA